MSKILAIEINGKSTNKNFTTKNIWSTYNGIIFHTQEPTYLENDAFPEERNGRISLLISKDQQCCENFGIRLKNSLQEIEDDIKALKFLLNKSIIKITKIPIDSIGKDLYNKDAFSYGFLIELFFTDNSSLPVEFYNFHNGGYNHTVKFVLPNEIFTHSL